MPETYEITLTTSTYGGDTMGRLPDAAVFVPFGLPGERVSIRLTEEKSSFARGELIEVIDTSPEESLHAANILANAADVIISICRMKCNWQSKPIFFAINFKELARSKIPQSDQWRRVLIRGIIAIMFNSIWIAMEDLAFKRLHPIRLSQSRNAISLKYPSIHFGLNLNSKPIAELSGPPFAQE